MLNLSFESGAFPSRFKEATVVPIFEKGDKQLAQNYRPISFLSVLLRVIENCMKSRVLLALDLSSSVLQSQTVWLYQRKNNETVVLNFTRNIYNSITDGIPRNITNQIEFTWNKEGWLSIGSGHI